MEDLQLLKEAIGSFRFAVAVSMGAIIIMFFSIVILSFFVYPQMVEERLTAVLESYEVTIE